MTQLGAVLVTGASSGIGLCTCLHLKQMGYSVYGTVRSDLDKQRLRRDHNLQAIIMDVCDTRSIEQGKTTLVSLLQDKPLAAIVNCAGVAIAGPLELIRKESLSTQFEVNVIGQMSICQAFIPLLRQSQGRIICVSSISGFIVTPLLGAYAASKFALEACIKSLRMELSHDGISVVSIQPGPVKTPIWLKSIDGSSQHLRDKPDLLQRYQGALFKAEHHAKTAGELRGIDSLVVARKIALALRAKNPRQRYLVGTSTHILNIIARLLPTHFLQRLLIKQRLPTPL